MPERKWCCKNRLHKAKNKPTNSPNDWRRVGSQVRTFERMGNNKQEAIRDDSKAFFRKIDNEIN